MARRELPVEPREVLGKKVKKLRRSGILPANIYGHTGSVAVQVESVTLQRTLKEMTVNEVIDIKVQGERSARPAIIQHVQRNPVTSQMLHADFYQVSLREKMRADVPVVLVGESEAVKTFNGVLLHPTNALHVEALPLDLPERIEVDVSVLTELDTSIHVRDLTIPDKVTVLTDGDVVVALVAAPRLAAEEEEVAAEVEEAEAAAEAEEEAAAEEGAAETRAEAETEPASESE
jgi:large subunit ribosomal protein L25